jgi:hypothetical protein
MHPPEVQSPESLSPAVLLGPVAERMRELHHPVRTRILLELAADVDALSADLRRSGIPAVEAARRAAERVVPSEAALDALVRLHLPLYRRVMEPVSDTALRRWERGALLAVTVAVLATGVGLLGSQGLLRSPSPFLWVVLGLAGGIVALALAKGFQLFVRREHRPGGAGRGLWTLLVLSALSLLAAWTGAVVDLWRLAATMEAGLADPGPLLLDWLFRESVLITTALLSALAGSLAWFLLAQGAASIRGGEEAVARALEPISTGGGTT